MEKAEYEKEKAISAPEIKHQQTLRYAFTEDFHLCCFFW